MLKKYLLKIILVLCIFFLIEKEPVFSLAPKHINLGDLPHEIIYYKVLPFLFDKSDYLYGEDVETKFKGTEIYSRIENWILKKYVQNFIQLYKQLTNIKINIKAFDNQSNKKKCISLINKITGLKITFNEIKQKNKDIIPKYLEVLLLAFKGSVNKEHNLIFLKDMINAIDNPYDDNNAKEIYIFNSNHVKLLFDILMQGAAEDIYEKVFNLLAIMAKQGLVKKDSDIDYLFQIIKTRQYNKVNIGRTTAIQTVCYLLDYTAKAGCLKTQHIDILLDILINDPETYNDILGAEPGTICSILENAAKAGSLTEVHLDSLLDIVINNSDKYLKIKLYDINIAEANRDYNIYDDSETEYDILSEEEDNVFSIESILQACIETGKFKEQHLEQCFKAIKKMDRNLTKSDNIICRLTDTLLRLSIEQSFLNNILPSPFLTQRMFCGKETNIWKNFVLHSMKFNNCQSYLFKEQKKEIEILDIHEVFLYSISGMKQKEIMQIKDIYSALKKQYYMPEKKKMFKKFILLFDKVCNQLKSNYIPELSLQDIKNARLKKVKKSQDIDITIFDKLKIHS